MEGLTQDNLLNGRSHPSSHDQPCLIIPLVQQVGQGGLPLAVAELGLQAAVVRLSAARVCVSHLEVDGRASCLARLLQLGGFFFHANQWPASHRPNFCECQACCCTFGQQ